ncbi:MAG TPA: tRNA (adenosine(37)-N6)-dimethylallyltransferase MiaA [Polyangiaceae bacterium]|nr:tRNA (adenosine(37)-N6)-dimethylallyltransferase MiaA [Polyangiaceae bacterium]
MRIARQSPDRLLAIVGPTASGKTSLAVGLAEAIGGEVVSADSVQVYRAFDVGSGKPTPAETARARHHLVGTLDPLEPMDAAAWATLADAAVTDIRARGRVPIVCGGTFLWVKALLFGLAGAPPADAATRASHRAIAERDGRPALHARLRAIDPASADRLHPNDLVRVSRALEVHELTGKTMSALQGEHGFLRARHDAVLLGLASEPATLTARITDRARAWLAEGWVDEVRALLDAGYADARAMASVGYAQVRDALEGRLPLDDLEGAIVRATRVFARRQRTWLNHVDVAWLPR